VLGQVDYLLDTGANDVLVVKATDDSVDDRERLIPWLVDSVVTKIDTESRSVWVSWYVDA
jgi:16S rRNA processing protein RimM